MLARLADRWCRSAARGEWSGAAWRRAYASAPDVTDQESALQVAILNAFARWVRTNERHTSNVTSLFFLGEKRQQTGRLGAESTAACERRRQTNAVYDDMHNFGAMDACVARNPHPSLLSPSFRHVIESSPFATSPTNPPLSLSLSLSPPVAPPSAPTPAAPTPAPPPAAAPPPPASRSLKRTAARRTA
jgi:hypothetical protein